MSPFVICETCRVTVVPGIRGIDRVRIHADLTMLARLGQVLARSRAVPLAA